MYIILSIQHNGTLLRSGRKVQISEGTKSSSTQTKDVHNLNLCHGHSLGLGQVDLGTVDLAVQEEGIGSQDTRGEEEDDRRGSGRTTTVSTHATGRELLRGL
jgi:hypothetical protein